MDFESFDNIERANSEFDEIFNQKSSQADYQPSRLTEITQKLRDILFNNYIKVYSPDGYDSITYNYNGQSGQDRYLNNPLTWFTTFVGLPNQCSDDGSLDGIRVFKNFIGWQDNKTNGRWWINVLTIPYAFVKNSIFVVAIFTQNTIKLFTEFLPGVISDILGELAQAGFDYSDTQIDEIWNHYQIGLDEDEPYPKKPNLLNDLRLYCIKSCKSIPYHLLDLLSALAYILSVLANTVRLIGRAVISPIDSVNAAWSLRHVVNHWLAKRTIKMNGQERHLIHVFPPLKYLGEVVGVLLSVLSIAVTSTVYAFLLPVLFAAAPAMGINLTPVLNFLAPALTHAHAVFATIGNVILPLLGQLSTVLTPAMTGFITVLGMSFGFGMTTIGPIINHFAKWCREWWRTSFDTSGVVYSNTIAWKSDDDEVYHANRNDNFKPDIDYNYFNEHSENTVPFPSQYGNTSHMYQQKRSTVGYNQDDDYNSSFRPSYYGKDDIEYI